MKRRTVLKQATASAGIIAAAGCLSEGGTGGGDETEETTEGSSGGSTTAPEPPASSVESKSVETMETSCGSENAASVSFEDGGASIDGDVAASDPCHEAAFGDVVVEDGELTVTMEVTATDADACEQCLGQVPYTAGVEVDGELSSATVKHRSQGETTTVAEASK